MRADPGRAAVGGTDEKQNEYKSLRTRREPATAPAWALSWGIEMAKTEKPKTRTTDQTRCGGRGGPGRAAVCRADEKQIEYKSRRMRRELATTPAWVLSWGIEMARKPKTENRGI